MLHAAKDILRHLVPNGVIETRQKCHREMKEAEWLLFNQTRRKWIARAGEAQVVGFLKEGGIPEKHQRLAPFLSPV